MNIGHALSISQPTKRSHFFCSTGSPNIETIQMKEEPKINWNIPSNILKKATSIKSLNIIATFKLCLAMLHYVIQSFKSGIKLAAKAKMFRPCTLQNFTRNSWRLIAKCNLAAWSLWNWSTLLSQKLIQVLDKLFSFYTSVANCKQADANASQKICSNILTLCF